MCTYTKTSGFLYPHTNTRSYLYIYVHINTYIAAAVKPKSLYRKTLLFIKSNGATDPRARL